MNSLPDGSASGMWTNANSVRSARIRLSMLMIALLAFVLVPFAIWGDQLERTTPLWLQSGHERSWVAVIGVALLIADVALPIPASIVSVALCWSLGPIYGGAAVAAGTFLSFAAGYGLGRVLPEPRLRRWIGADLWDRLRCRAEQADAWWIFLSRPLPVLAELSAVLSGVWRLPVGRTMTQAALASMAVGTLYGCSAWIGAKAPSVTLSLAVLLCLPVGFWFWHRLWLHRLNKSVPSTTSRQR